MNFDNFDWTTNSLVIAVKGPYFVVLPSKNPTCSVGVSKFTDIVCLSTRFREILFHYNLHISGQTYRMVDAKVLKDAANNDALLSFIDKNKSRFVDPNKTSKAQIERMRPLATLLKNFYVGFSDDYKQTMSHCFNNLLEFNVDGEPIFLPEDFTQSFLFIKFEPDLVRTYLKIGDAKLGTSGAALGECLADLGDVIFGFSRNAKFKDGETHATNGAIIHNDVDSIQNEEKICDICKVGLSKELAQFREECFGDDGKDF